jgi:hypothetical protein
MIILARVRGHNDLVTFATNKLHAADPLSKSEHADGMMHIDDRLGVRRRTNAAGPQTRFGGSLMPPEVVAA